MPNGLLYKFIHDFRKQQPGRISGVFASQGELWRAQKAFLTKTLSTFNMRNLSSEDLVMEEVERFFDLPGQKKARLVQGVGLFNLPVMSMLWKMTTEENLQYQDEKLDTIRRRQGHFKELDCSNCQ